MLNDLVLFDNKVCKIVATNAYRDCAELIDISDEDNGVVGKYAKHISPIPLTEEILDLNCIEYSEDDDMWYIQDGVYTIFELDVRDNDFAFGDFCSIKYVHELQRALRLCGLCELADNFKVE